MNQICVSVDLEANRLGRCLPVSKEKLGGYHGSEATFFGLIQHHH